MTSSQKKTLDEKTNVRYVRTRLSNYISAKPFISRSHYDMLKAAISALTEIEESVNVSDIHESTEKETIKLMFV